MEKTSKNLDVILWTIFQYSNIIKICGFDLETGEFRISSAITSIVNEPTINDLGGFEPKCTIYTSNGSKYNVVGYPCNLQLHTKIMQQIEKHVKKRDPNVNWHDVSYFADVSFFDGDFL